MTNYTVNINQPFKLNMDVSTTVTRSPAVIEGVVQALIIFTALFIFQHFMSRLLEKPHDKKLKRNYIILGALMSLPIILLLVQAKILFGKEFYFLIIFLFSFLLTINLFVRFLEEFPDINKILLYLIISLVITFLLFNLAQHYPSINFLKPLANWFGIDY